MNTDSLKDKRAQVETKFNELAEQKRQLEEEMLKLQGEYRSLSALIEEEPKKETKK